MEHVWIQMTLKYIMYRERSRLERLILYLLLR